MNNGTIRLGGAVTLWRAASFFDAAKLKQEFENLNLEAYCPANSTNDANLRYALGKTFDKSGEMIRPTKTGFAVVEEVRGEGTNKNSYQQRWAFWLEGTEHNTLRIDPYNYDTAERVAAKFAEFCGLVTGDHVTKSLVALAAKFGGVSLKPSGGVYWIPDHNLADWQDVSLAVERCPAQGECAIYLIRHSLDEDAIRAVRDGLIQEIVGETAIIEKEVAEDELGKRALDHRVLAAQVLTDKITLYEQLLGVGLERLRETCTRVKDAASLASLRLAAANYSEAS